MQPAKKTRQYQYKDISMESQLRRVTEKELVDGESPSIQTVTKSQYYVDKNIDIRAVEASLNNIFTWIPGERILNPEFGSTLRKYLYEGITDSNRETIVAEIRGVCVKWEPRIRIEEIRDVTTEYDVEDNTVRLEIKYSIPSISNNIMSYQFSTTRR